MIICPSIWPGFEWCCAYWLALISYSFIPGIMVSLQSAHYTFQHRTAESFGFYSKWKILQRKQICRQPLLSPVTGKAIYFVSFCSLAFAYGHGLKVQCQSYQHLGGGLPPLTNRTLWKAKTARGCACAGVQQSLETSPWNSHDQRSTELNGSVRSSQSRGKDRYHQHPFIFKSWSV